MVLVENFHERSRVDYSANLWRFNTSACSTLITIIQSVTARAAHTQAANSLLVEYCFIFWPRARSRHVRTTGTARVVCNRRRSLSIWSARRQTSSLLFLYIRERAKEKHIAQTKRSRAKIFRRQHLHTRLVIFHAARRPNWSGIESYVYAAAYFSHTFFSPCQAQPLNCALLCECMQIWFGTWELALGCEISQLFLEGVEKLVIL